jgi:membrane protease YdiL (CAAX protease family)
MISAAMFAFLHGDLGVLWFYYFMSGLALFAARFRFNGLLVPILMHIAANGTMVANALYNC